MNIYEVSFETIYYALGDASDPNEAWADKVEKKSRQKEIVLAESIMEVLKQYDIKEPILSVSCLHKDVAVIYNPDIVYDSSVYQAMKPGTIYAVDNKGKRIV